MMRILILAFLGLVLTACDSDWHVPSPPGPSPTPISTPPSTIPPSRENPTCHQEMGKDGPGGFLWKPKGDHSQKLVILFPAKFVVKFESVRVVTKSNAIEGLNFTGFSNGDRQTWRGSLPGNKYKNYSLVKAFDKDQICKWRIGKGGERWD